MLLTTLHEKDKGLLLFNLGFMILAFLLLTASAVPEENHLDPDATVRHYFHNWQEIASDDSLSENELQAKYQEVIGELFYFERLAAQLLQRTWLSLSTYDQNRFIEALKVSIVRRIRQSSLVQHADHQEVMQLNLRSKEIKEKFARLDYDFVRRNRKVSVRVFMLKSPEGSWKVSNLTIGKNSIMRYYYSFCDDILKKYSFSYLVAELGDYGYVVLEDFESSPVDTLPAGWTWKKKDNDKHKPYRVRVENGNKYLAATDEGESVILGKNIKWNLRKYPYVSFRWRVHRIPEGADERYNKSVDSAAGIYFVYKKKLGLIPESVKYVWSSTLPVGSAMRRSGVGRPWMVVADSGKDHLGEWRTYVFNAYEAYKKTFGGNPPEVALGIGILSDANSMKSYAYADYDDIRALKRADADSGVKKILKAE